MSPLQVADAEWIEYGPRFGWLAKGDVNGGERTMRARRIMAGFRRFGIVLGLILTLPALYGLTTWATLGHPPPKQVYLFLAAGSGAYVLATSLGWIIVAFKGEDDTQ